MIVIGVILLLVAYLLPDLIPVPPGVEHVLSVLGWVAIVVGIILLVLSLLGRPVGRGVRGSGRWY
jgi:hypothetical protein